MPRNRAADRARPPFRPRPGLCDNRRGPTAALPVSAHPHEERVMPEYVVIATWPFGQTAVKVAAELLQKGQPALDAALAGAAFVCARRPAA